MVLGDGGIRRRGWLRQDPGQRRPFYRGRTFAEQAMGAVRRHDVEALERVLVRWRDELDPV